MNGVNLAELPYTIDKTARLNKMAQARIKGLQSMMKLIKAVLVLAILAVAGLTGYAYLGDLSPVQGEKRLPVVLNADQ